MNGSVRKHGPTWSYYFNIEKFDGKQKNEDLKQKLMLKELYVLH